MRTTKKLPVKLEWERLRSKVIQLDAELELGTSSIPTIQMCDLLIVGEDHRFRFHPGVDLIGLIRAIWSTYIRRERQGGSTIAMQLVRIITGRYERTWKRKIREIILAVLLTQYFGRDRLPVWYLCIGYYGWRMNNFKQACSRLRLKPNSIVEIDAARLVARLKYPEPSIYIPERIHKIERRAQHLVAINKKYQTTVYFYATIQNYNVAPTSH